MNKHERPTRSKKIIFFGIFNYQEHEISLDISERILAEVLRVYQLQLLLRESFRLETKKKTRENLVYLHEFLTSCGGLSTGCAIEIIRLTS